MSRQWIQTRPQGLGKLAFLFQEETPNNYFHLCVNAQLKHSRNDESHFLAWSYRSEQGHVQIIQI